MRASTGEVLQERGLENRGGGPEDLRGKVRVGVWRTQVEREGKTQSPPGPRPEGLGGWTKSESGIDLGAHEIGVSGIVNSNISPKVQ